MTKETKTSINRRIDIISAAFLTIYVLVINVRQEHIWLTVTDMCYQLRTLLEMEGAKYDTVQRNSLVIHMFILKLCIIKVGKNEVFMMEIVL